MANQSTLRRPKRVHVSPGESPAVSAHAFAAAQAAAGTRLIVTDVATGRCKFVLLLASTVVQLRRDIAARLGYSSAAVAHAPLRLVSGPFVEDDADVRLLRTDDHILFELADA